MEDVQEYGVRADASYAAIFEEPRPSQFPDCPLTIVTCETRSTTAGSSESQIARSLPFGMEISQHNIIGDPKASSAIRNNQRSLKCGVMVS